MCTLNPFTRRRPLVAVVRLQGMIAATTRGTLSEQALAPVLDRAFRKGRPRAVALAINSPGGSPVQSSLIAARIRGLADGIGHLVPTMRARYGRKVRFRHHAVRRPWMSRLGFMLGGEALAGIEERAACARFGL